MRMVILSVYTCVCIVYVTGICILCLDMHVCPGLWPYVKSIKFAIVVRVHNFIVPSFCRTDFQRVVIIWCCFPGTSRPDLPYWCGPSSRCMAWKGQGLRSNPTKGPTLDLRPPEADAQPSVLSGKGVQVPAAERSAYTSLAERLLASFFFFGGKSSSRG